MVDYNDVAQAEPVTVKHLDPLPAKKDEIPDGPVRSTPGAARAAYAQAPPPSAPEAAAKIAAINGDPQHPFWSGDPAAVSEMRKLLRETMSAEERTAEQDAPLDELRARFAVEKPWMPSTLQGQWDEGHEGNFLTYAADQGLEAPLVRDLMSWYGRAGVARQGNLSGDDAVEDFKREFGARLSPTQIDLLVRWHREEVERK